MSNPWLGIPLADYESHMAMPSVGQAEALSALLAEALQQYAPDSIAIIGCAGGNGFDRVIPSVTTRVVGVDINPEYIAAASVRYGGRIPGIELHVADIQVDQLTCAPVALIFAGLLFEYVSASAALKNLASICRPGGHLIAVLQQPSPCVSAVSPTPYRSLLALTSIMRLVPSDELARCAAQCGFRFDNQRSVVLSSGKALTVQAYRYQAGEVH